MSQAEDIFATQIVLDDIAGERARQRFRWGNEHDDRHDFDSFVTLIQGRLGRLFRSSVMSSKDYQAARRKILVQSAAMCVALIEKIDRETGE